MANSSKGFAGMPQDKVRQIARKGGQSSPTKFQPGDPRAREAGRKGGQARAQAPDISSGELGRRGVHARWEEGIED